MRRSTTWVLAISWVLGCASADGVGDRRTEPAGDAGGIVLVDAGTAHDDAGDADGSEPSGTDAGVSSRDAAEPPPRDCETGEAPLELADETWMWVPVPETRCGYGTPTGFAVNATARSTKLLVYLMGGGGCYDALTCGMGRAANLAGYDQTTAARELGFFQRGSIFDRSDPDNPFADWDWVFVPYCTGDFHTGTSTSSYGVEHRGAENLEHDLAHVVPTFCDAERVVVAGSSAGGFGAVASFETVSDAFAGARIDLVDDSGPFLPPPYMAGDLEARMRSAWSSRPPPPGCAGCGSAFWQYYGYLFAAHPDSTFSLISSRGDYSIGGYFGLGPDAMAAGLDALRSSAFAGADNAHVFFLPGSDHVWLGRPLSTVTSGGRTLSEFLRRQLDRDAAWSDAVP